MIYNLGIETLTLHSDATRAGSLGMSIRPERLLLSVGEIFLNRYPGRFASLCFRLQHSSVVVQLLSPVDSL